MNRLAIFFFLKTSTSIPEALSAVSEAEEIPEEISKPTARSYTSESFESSSDAQKSIPVAKTLPVVKPVLSPRHGARRRYSSGSDDSANLSHTGKVFFFLQKTCAIFLDSKIFSAFSFVILLL